LEIIIESRAFIRQATTLNTRIHLPANGPDVSPDSPKIRAELQKELNMLFSGMQNPSLPCASRLATDAQKQGFTVEPRVLHRLQQAESHWP